MKILEIIPALFEGGAERFVVDLSNQITESGEAEVMLVSLFNIDKKQFLHKELDKKIKVIELNKKLGFDLRVMVSLYKIIKQERPDIVHTHLRSIEYVIFAMCISKAKFFHTIHNDAFQECPSQRIRQIRNRFFRTKKCTPITISAHSSESYQKAYSNTCNIEIKNGRYALEPSLKFPTVKQEVDSYKKTNETRIFINVARISSQKNQEMLIRAFNDMIKLGHDIVLLIVGTKWDEKICQNIEAIKDERIHLLGTKENPIDYLYCAEAFLLTSTYEGMPISLIEAFQTGCIPVCTPAGGVKSMIQHQENGLLSNEISLKAYEQVLEEYLSLPNKKLKMLSQNGKKSFDTLYNIKTTARNYLNTFANLP